MTLACASKGNTQTIWDVAERKSFKSYRVTSVDPARRNIDFRVIPPGKKLQLADVNGNGSFTHFWLTVSSRDPDHLRQLVLEIYWDGAERPAVECPIGDFFCQGPGQYVEFSSAVVASSGVRALNCYWRMPFRKRARIFITNEGNKPVDALYYNLDYVLDPSDKTRSLYFHTQYRNHFPAPKGKPLTVCEAAGRGNYVGTALTVLANTNGWWGEGNDEWFIDGATSANITGTGSEDYFCGAFDFGHTYSTPYYGVTYFDNERFGGEKRGIQNTVYRWHILDAIPFQSSLRFTLEHGRWGFDENRRPFGNHYTTTAMYYSDKMNGEGPRLRPYQERIPKLIEAGASENQ